MKSFNKVFLSIFGVVGLCAWAQATQLSLPTGDGQPPAKTTITSQTLEMVSGATENIFYFSKNVVVQGTNLKMTADQMVVTAKRAPEDTAPVPGGIAKSPAGGTVEKIVAVGNVRLYQQGRESISGRAEFYPKEGKVILTDKPRVIDAKAIVSGWRITLFQGERKVMVEQDPTQAGLRPSVSLDSIPNLGFDPKTEPPAPPAPTPAPPAPTPVPAPPPPAATLPSGGISLTPAS